MILALEKKNLQKLLRGRERSHLSLALDLTNNYTHASGESFARITGRPIAQVVAME